MPTTTALTADQQAVAIKNLTEAMFACQTILERLTKSAEIPEVAVSAFAVAEFRLADAAQTLCIETQGTAQMAERYAGIRKANARVRELEELLGQGASAPQTQAALKVLAKRLNEWWDLHGFGHISELHFTDYGHLEVKFSCMLFGAFRLLDSKTPVSDKQRKTEWLQSLRVRGYDVAELEDGHDMELLDTEASRKVLRDLFRKHLPSSRVTSFGNRGSSDDVMVMTDVTVFIRELVDVERLVAAAD